MNKTEIKDHFKQAIYLKKWNDTKLNKQLSKRVDNFVKALEGGYIVDKTKFKSIANTVTWKYALENTAKRAGLSITHEDEKEFLGENYMLSKSYAGYHFCFYLYPSTRSDGESRIGKGSFSMWGTYRDLPEEYKGSAGVKRLERKLSTEVSDILHIMMDEMAHHLI